MQQFSEEVSSVEQWGVFETSFRAAAPRHAFDAPFRAVFTQGERSLAADGFYDGDDHWRVRFMPDAPGEWRYVTESDLPVLDGHSGVFVCTPPTPGNHGPVGVRDLFHFAYADGTPYYPVGTTCYAWTHQGNSLERQTLETLQSAPFNKLRMCLLPKHYDYSHNEPPLHAFERNSDGAWDFARLNPAFFQHQEQRIAQLGALGIEADLILFHPYDRWGYASMPQEADDRYLRHVVARLAAYRHVWWSMANEWDFMEAKTEADFDRYFEIVEQSDPSAHLRSVHHCIRWYDHTKPWVTHVSIQGAEMNRVSEWRGKYQKPIVMDECCYEGDIEHGWGNITAEILTQRFWLGTVSGGYVGHGETYLHPEDILWWSKGGVLHGQSPSRIGFLRAVLEEGPPQGWEPAPGSWDRWGACKGDQVFLFYFPDRQPRKMTFSLPEGHCFRAEVIDTWNRTITPLEGRYSGACELAIFGKPHTAVRFWKTEENF